MNLGILTSDPESKYAIDLKLESPTYGIADTITVTDGSNGKIIIDKLLGLQKEQITHEGTAIIKVLNRPALPSENMTLKTRPSAIALVTYGKNLSVYSIKVS